MSRSNQTHNAANSNNDKKFCILIVEDNLEMQTFIFSIISNVRENLHVDFVNDGLAAVDYLTYSTPDLVITDFLMPGLNGIELMSRVREVHGASIRFILVTGGLSSDMAPGLTEADIKANYNCLVIRKPFRTSVLRSTVDNTLMEVEIARLHDSAS